MSSDPVVAKPKFPLLPKDPPQPPRLRPRQKHHTGRGKFGASDSLRRRAYWIKQQEIGDRNRAVEKQARKGVREAQAA